MTDIRIKTLKENHVIDYNDNSQEFMLKNGETTIRSGKTQKELEEYLDRVLKADNKFNPPIKAIGFVWNSIKLGTITSSNIEDKSFWFVNEKGTRNKGEWRDNSYSGKPSYNYFEQTTKNLESIATINKNTETIRQLQHDNNNLKASLENPINAEFIAKYKEAK
jgi:hypothetical protein